MTYLLSLVLSLFFVLATDGYRLSSAVSDKTNARRSAAVCKGVNSVYDSWCAGYTEATCVPAFVASYCTWESNGQSVGSQGDISGQPGQYGPSGNYGNAASYCGGTEALIIVVGNELLVRKPDGMIISCAKNFGDAVDATLAADGSIYVVEDMNQVVKRVAPKCGEVTTVLTAQDGLVRPSSIAYGDNGGGSFTLFVSNSQRNSGFVFSFDSVGNFQKKALGNPAQFLSYLYFFNGELFGVDGNKNVGKFNGNTYSWSSFPTINALVDIRHAQPGCGGKFYIAGDDNNDIYECTDISDPNSCIPLCPGEVTNPWSVTSGVDCSIYTASRGPGAGRIFKYDSLDCGNSKEIGNIGSIADGIKALIPFFDETAMAVDCSAVQGTGCIAQCGPVQESCEESVCENGYQLKTPVPNCDLTGGECTNIYCCDKIPDVICDVAVCNEGYKLRVGPPTCDYYNGGCTNAVCCRKDKVPCEYNVCEHGYELKTPVPQCHLAGGECTNTFCCVKIPDQVCDVNVCEEGYKLKVGPPTCDYYNGGCTNDACCEITPCKEAVCENGYELKTPVPNCNLAPGGECTNAFCCVKIPDQVCDDNICEEGYKLKAGPPTCDFYNGGCTNEACCKITPCKDTVCENGYELKTPVPNCNLAAGGECTNTFCCVKIPDQVCDVNICEEGYKLKAGPPTCDFYNGGCTNEACCEITPCEDTVCENGYELKTPIPNCNLAPGGECTNAFCCVKIPDQVCDDSVCEEGYKLKAGPPTCDFYNGGCTNEACCEITPCKNTVCENGYELKTPVPNCNLAAGGECTNTFCCVKIPDQVCDVNICEEGYKLKAGPPTCDFYNGGCTNEACCEITPCEDTVCENGYELKTPVPNCNLAPGGECTNAFCCVKIPDQVCDDNICEEGYKLKAGPPTCDFYNGGCTNDFCCEEDIRNSCGSETSMGKPQGSFMGEFCCFVSNTVGDEACMPGPQGNRWGWEIRLEYGNTYTFDLWAGAGQCDTGKGVKVGTVSVDYTTSTKVTATFNLDSNDFGFEDAHIYVEDTMLTNSAFGTWTQTQDAISGLSTTFVIENLDENNPILYTSYHATILFYNC